MARFHAAYVTADNLGIPLYSCGSGILRRLCSSESVELRAHNLLQLDTLIIIDVELGT